MFQNVVSLVGAIESIRVSRPNVLLVVLGERGAIKLRAQVEVHADGKHWETLTGPNGFRVDDVIAVTGTVAFDPATGAVALGARVERGDIPRADVAAVVAAVIDAEEAVGQQWDLVSGNVPVHDAVRSAG